MSYGVHFATPVPTQLFSAKGTEPHKQTGKLCAFVPLRGYVFSLCLSVRHPRRERGSH